MDDTDARTAGEALDRLQAFPLHSRTGSGSVRQRRPKLSAMPRMNERVKIATSRTTIELSWKSREALLHEIRHLESARGIIDAFEAVGTSRPVPLTRHDQSVLFEVINQWALGVNVDGLPSGIWALRCALADEFHDAPDSE
jgi:hypothetical protein